jgi:hypothetical protein
LIANWRLVFLTTKALAMILAVSYGVLGISAVILGYITASLLRLAWSGRTALADGALAVVLAMVCVVGEPLLLRSSSNAILWSVIVSYLGVILRHLGRFIVSRRLIRTAA